MSYVLGLTGSIGMGKSTTAALLQAKGLPVWDADNAVHQLYAQGGAAVTPIAQLCPDVFQYGAIDRSLLRAAIQNDPTLLDRVQTVVHPLVAQHRKAFLAMATAPIVVLDIPLLFEIGAQAQCDGVLVVTANPDVQMQRLAQRGMAQTDIDLLLGRQMPDIDKRARATWVVETLSIAHVDAELERILAQIKKDLLDA